MHLLVYAVLPLTTYLARLTNNRVMFRDHRPYISIRIIVSTAISSPQSQCRRKRNVQKGVKEILFQE
jgi:hypothetical protein